MKSRRDEYAEATRKALLNESAKLFSKQGYSATSLSQIVDKARVTKGAFYHHFDNKLQVYAACYELQAKTVAHMVDQVPVTDDPWRDTIARCQAFFDCATAKSPKGVSIQEAITVLGWEKWRELDETCTMGGLLRSVERLKDEGMLKPLDTSLLVDAIYGMLVNAMMSLSAAKDKTKSKKELIKVIEHLLSGMLL